MKLNIAVIFGGKSVEHEISVISALQALKNFDTDKYNTIPIYITKEGLFYSGSQLTEITNYQNIPSLLKTCQKVHFDCQGDKTFLVSYDNLLHRPKKLALIDVAMPIVHGTNVEDGVLQGFLATLNLPIVGCNVISSAICMDKYVMKQALQPTDVPVLPCLRFYNSPDFDLKTTVKKTIKTFSLPVIVKPTNLGSSVGITKASSQEELIEAIELAFQFSNYLLIEPAITNLKETNCSVLGDADQAIASECEEPISSDKILSYADKYIGGEKNNSTNHQQGMTNLKRKLPADISQQLKQDVQKYAIAAFQSLGCSGVARIDFLYDQDKKQLWLNEINTIPGSLSFYLWEATGKKYRELIDDLITIAMKQHRKNGLLSFSFDTNVFALGQFQAGSKGSK